jgi:RNA polymerase sigma-70 factor (ECF subfamily)
LDATAFDALFEATRKSLRTYLVRVSGDVCLADDLMQEAFLRVLSSPPREADLRAQRSYVFTTAARLLQAHWRKKRPLTWLPWRDPGDEEPLETLPCPEPCQERIARGRQAVTLGWSGLSPRQRSLLWLAYVEGLDHAELAAALGLRQGSVKVLLHRARTHMIATLKSLGIKEPP